MSFYAFIKIHREGVDFLQVGIYFWYDVLNQMYTRSAVRTWALRVLIGDTCINTSKSASGAYTKLASGTHFELVICYLADILNRR